MANLQNLKLNNTNIFDLLYPIGSIYETSNAEFNPNEIWNGTWERIKGKVIVGVDEDDTDFESSQLSGGEKTHTLITAEMPSHSHNLYGGCTTTTNTLGNSLYESNGWIPNLSKGYSVNSAIISTGGNQAHNNLQPYYTAYIWERIS